ncbi:lactonase family protein [Jonesia quinghaiensis]|uniref:lactonase family protein n=1 Tax=Jonesia quinghaiensis TaxID=262806 RepID=UPI000421E2CD|nr:beta-propeller fold lactonase family protein [Jonesia quinghaiensis]
MIGSDFPQQLDIAVGTYPTGENPGSGEGIWLGAFDRNTGELSALRQVIDLPSPSFLAQARNPATLYAVSEVPSGELHALERTGDTLTLRGTSETMGSEPCHVMALGDQVLVANYGTGSLAAVEAGPGLNEHSPVALYQHAGSGPRSDRQEGPHAHFVVAVPTTQYVWVADLGADSIALYEGIQRADGSRGLIARGTAVKFPGGTGPRHIAFDSHGTAFVVGELDCSVHVVALDLRTGTGDIRASHPLTGAQATQGGEHGDDKQENSDGDEGPLPSHIEISSDGTMLYVAVRGSDTLDVFSVEPGEEESHLSLVTSYSLAGRWPRHFAVVSAEGGGDFIILAQQNSDEVEILRAHRDGQIQEVSRHAVPAPACIMPLRPVDA